MRLYSRTIMVYDILTRVWMKIYIPYRSIHVVAFLLLAFLCYQSHQLVRHLAGALLCGGFGRMTFTITVTQQPCKLPLLITLSGPVWTYALSWLGMVFIELRGIGVGGFVMNVASF